MSIKNASSIIHSASSQLEDAPLESRNSELMLLNDSSADRSDSFSFLLFGSEACLAINFKLYDLDEIHHLIQPITSLFNIKHDVQNHHLTLILYVKSYKGL